MKAASEKRRDLRHTAGLAEASELTAVIDACYPLQRITGVHSRVDAGHKAGNVVVTMTGHP